VNHSPARCERTELRADGVGTWRAPSRKRRTPRSSSDGPSASWHVEAAGRSRRGRRAADSWRRVSQSLEGTRLSVFEAFDDNRAHPPAKEEIGQCMHTPAASLPPRVRAVTGAWAQSSDGAHTSPRARWTIAAPRFSPVMARAPGRRGRARILMSTSHSRVWWGAGEGVGWQRLKALLLRRGQGASQHAHAARTTDSGSARAQGDMGVEHHNFRAANEREQRAWLGALYVFHQAASRPGAAEPPAPHVRRRTSLFARAAKIGRSSCRTSPKRPCWPALTTSAGMVRGGGRPVILSRGHCARAVDRA
jgi:hypothetical protein